MQFTEYGNKLVGLVAKVLRHGFTLQNELGKLRKLELGHKYANIKMELKLITLGNSTEPRYNQHLNRHH